MDDLVRRDLRTPSDSLDDQLICTLCHVPFMSEDALFAHLQHDHDEAVLASAEARGDLNFQAQRQLDETMRAITGMGDDERYREAGLALAVEDICLSLAIEDRALEEQEEGPSWEP